MSEIRDLKQNHPGEWLAIAITAFQEDEPAEGVLLAHAVERWVLMQSFRPQRDRPVIVTFADRD